MLLKHAADKSQRGRRFPETTYKTAKWAQIRESVAGFFLRLGLNGSKDEGEIGAILLGTGPTT